MKRLFYLLFVCCVVFVGCGKEGCTDPLAANYDLQATKDDGSCIYLATISTIPITDITTNSASSGGIISSDGGQAVTLRGVCWSTSPNPTIANDTTINGSGTGTFSSNISGLFELTYVRAYATNVNGTAYGDEFNIIFSPSLSTAFASNVTFVSATLGGNITSNGGSSVIQRGVCWSTSPNPTITNSITNDGSGTGSFSSNLTGLTANTTYYVRAYAINSVYTAYGNEVSFTTTGFGSPYQGGIIFYLDGNGGGLIAAPYDQSSAAEWGCYGDVTGANGSALGTGNQNTIDIEAECTTAGTAADICANLTLNGYSDWFLPSKDELNLMYENIGQGNALGLGNVGGFSNWSYWSSTEVASTLAWRQDFFSGHGGNWGKASTLDVRAVRAF